MSEGLTFLFLRRTTLMASVDTTMFTFFFFMFFSLNSYCGGRATQIKGAGFCSSSSVPVNTTKSVGSGSREPSELQSGTPRDGGPA